MTRPGPNRQAPGDRERAATPAWTSAIQPFVDIFRPLNSRAGYAGRGKADHHGPIGAAIGAETIGAGATRYRPRLLEFGGYLHVPTTLPLPE